MKFRLFKANYTRNSGSSFKHHVDIQQMSGKYIDLAAEWNTKEVQSL
jgi:hypothetical protein